MIPPKFWNLSNKEKKFFFKSIDAESVIPAFPGLHEKNILIRESLLKGKKDQRTFDLLALNSLDQLPFYFDNIKHFLQNKLS